MKLMLLCAPVLLAMSAPALAQPMVPAEYVATAGASDLYESQSSQIVLETTKNPKIKAFATMMVADHGKSTAAVKAAAAQSKVAATPAKLMPSQAELIAALRAERGPARDAVYVAQQRAAHGQALAVHKGYAMDGMAPALKKVAAGIVPVVMHHIEMLKAM